jgi:ubiquinone/menaquinone biosynthesis C-methylase UbiE
MPFDDGTFDVIWTQHASMNIQDKDRLYREIWRVMKPGGLLGIYDIFAGPEEPVYFPVPWARDPSISFLMRPEALRSKLEEIGITIRSWNDTTASSSLSFRRVADKIKQSGLPPLGFHVFLGPDWQVMAENLARNLEDGRVSVVEVVAQKP